MTPEPWQVESLADLLASEYPDREDAEKRAEFLLRNLPDNYMCIIDADNNERSQRIPCDVSSTYTFTIFGAGPVKDPSLYIVHEGTVTILALNYYLNPGDTVNLSGNGVSPHLWSRLA